jgi:hypothetical protein
VLLNAQGESEVDSDKSDAASRDAQYLVVDQSPLACVEAGLERSNLLICLSLFQAWGEFGYRIGHWHTGHVLFFNCRFLYTLETSNRSPL